MSVMQKILRLGEGKRLKECAEYAQLVNTYEDEMKARSDAELRALTDIFRARLVEGETLDDVLPEAFATVREAASRALGQRHYDVQIMGGVGLHRGWIAEMKTGEGKTLVATAPAYLNALAGKGVHIVTTNDYLAGQQGAAWMGRVYRFLGMSVGLIQAQMRPDQRRPAYAADITYGTNSEFGFDYLRDNMAIVAEDRVQRGHFFGIVDEVDSILIDEARTPLIISGPAEESAKWYRTFARLVPRLKPEVHYEVDEKKRTVAVTEDGVHEVERMLGIENLYDQISSPLVHYLQNALRAQGLYKRDVDYLVRDGEVKIVDEFTGRILEGRRYSEGMHQAIEAKENVRIKEENVTLATITYQNYFRMYDKLSGMTGTAMTEAAEFETIYKMNVVEIPTNRPMIRSDHADQIYKNEEGKYAALVEDIVERNTKGQPILIGTISVEKSEKLARLLDKRGVSHHVLNAKQHEREAYVIAQAGKKGSVTVATNMAGRGVDIILGGNSEYEIKQDLLANGYEQDSEPYEREMKRRLSEQQEQWEKEHNEVVELGGLYVLGTERHESRRIDNQLRGRSGRQGDPGESRFYLSLEDDLMRLFATGMVERVMSWAKIPDDVPIEAKMVTRAIQRAQHQREEQNFEIRKNVLKYDDVINKQREAIYARRNQVLDGEDLAETADNWMQDVVESTVLQFANDELPFDEWDLPGLVNAMKMVYPTALTPESFDADTVVVDELIDRFIEEAREIYTRRAEEIGEEQFRDIERRVLLSVLDSNWREHLYEMDYLQEGIGLRAIGQRDPLVEYTNEGFSMFRAMEESIKQGFVQYMFHVQVVREQTTEQQQAEQQRQQSKLRFMHEQAGQGEQAAVLESARSDKVGRNAPCPCGSGKKYKKCHGAGIV
ncbi:MAG: preprotein translocase subunit SecA [Actinobacteria bacterium]|nr:preprotein translocase subunit SecA [Actinomycetota bacterium]